MRARGLFVLSYLVVTCLNAQNSIGIRNAGNIQPLLDYRLPAWGCRTLQFDFDVRGQNLDQEKDYAEYHINNQHNDYRFSVSPGFVAHRESDRRIFHWSHSLASQFRSNKTTEKFTGIANRPENKNTKQSQDNLNFNSYVSLENYFIKNIFLAASFNNNWGYNGMRTKSEKRLERTSSIKNINTELGFTLGIGKIREVTPVIHALRFRERLHALGRQQNISDAEVLRMAAFFTRRNDYNRVFNRADRHFWQDFYAAFPEIAAGLTPFEHEYLSEYNRENRGRRFTGWQLRSGVSFSQQWQKRRDEDPGREIDRVRMAITDERGGFFNLAAQYDKNLTLNHMLEFRGSFRWGTNIGENAFDKKYGSVTFSTLYLWEIRDRLVATTRFSWGKRIGEKVPEIAIENLKRYVRRTANLSWRLAYFIEDQISLNNTFSYEQVRYYPHAFSFDRSNDFNYRLGFTYYFWRHLN